MISEPQIQRYCSEKMAAIVTKWFNGYACDFHVNTPLRVAAFLSQVIHESDRFSHTRETGSGDAYEGRLDLGNIYKGDGKKFAGRGYLRIVGRTNYAACSVSLFRDRNKLLITPDLLTTPQYAMLSAFWYWDLRSLNRYADIQFLEEIRRRISGGVRGMEDTALIYNDYCTEFGMPLYVANVHPIQN